MKLVLRNAETETDRAERLVVEAERARQVVRAIQRLAVQRPAEGDPDALDMVEALAHAGANLLGRIVAELQSVAREYGTGASDAEALAALRKAAGIDAESVF